MKGITIYTKSTCPYCASAKALLSEKKLPFQEIPIDNDEGLRQEMIDKSGRTTVPQIFFNEVSVGGCDDLYALEERGELDKLLQSIGEYDGEEKG